MPILYILKVITLLWIVLYVMLRWYWIGYRTIRILPLHFKKRLGIFPSQNFFTVYLPVSVWYPKILCKLALTYQSHCFVCLVISSWCLFLTIIRQYSSRTPFRLKVVFIENSVSLKRTEEGWWDAPIEVYSALKQKCKCPQKMWVTSKNVYKFLQKYQLPLPFFSFYTNTRPNELWTDTMWVISLLGSLESPWNRVTRHLRVKN